MDKVFGAKTIYAPIREDGNRYIVSCEYKEEEDGVNATWQEIIFYKKITPRLSFSIIREAIINSINEQTDNAILNGFEWNNTKVWLSAENQRNFSEAQRIAQMMPEVMLPITFKLGEGENGDAIYYTFNTSEELTQFYLQAVNYINQQLNIGWQRKDSIDWSVYEITEA